MAASAKSHASLAAVQSVSLLSADGMLTCEQTSGKGCTAEQVQALNEIAATLKLSISYKAPDTH